MSKGVKLNRKGISPIVSFIVLGIIILVAITSTFFFKGTFLKEAARPIINESKNISIIENKILPYNETSVPTQNISKLINETRVREIENLVESLPSGDNSKEAIKVDLTKEGKVQIIVEVFSREKINEVLSTLTREEFELNGILQLTPEFGGFITQSGLEKLQKNPYVIRISYDFPSAPTLITSIPWINANLAQDLGYDGEAQTICIIDSGIDYTHDAFGKCNRTNNINDGSCSKVIGGYDYLANPDDSDPFDEIGSDKPGHGTHVSAIAVGDGSIKGVAPKAKLVALRAINGTSLDVKKSIEWCILNKTKYNISVISMSFAMLGQNGAEILYNSNCDNAVDDGGVAQTANLIKQYNISTIAASGNAWSLDKIASPACGSNVTAVSAINDFTDKLLLDSNRNQLVKLVAPGSLICSARATNTGFGSASSSSCPSGYAEASGTSMAVPHVSGAIALLKQKNPNLLPDDITYILNKTGVPIIDSGKSNLTFSRIDVGAAVAYLTTLTIPKENTIYFYNGEVRQNQTWQINLTLNNLQNKLLTITLTGISDGNEVNLTLINPSNQIITSNTATTIDKITLQNLSAGVYTIKVYGKKIISTDDTNRFNLTRQIKTIPGSTPSPPGGINFTSAEISYIDACNPENGIIFIMKAKKANSGDTIINLSDVTNNFTKFFKAALVTPNLKHWVSLPLGSVDVDSIFAQTDLARQLLEDDVDLKHTYVEYGEENMMKNVYDYWFSTGGSGGPDWWFRTAIIPGNIEVNGSSCNIFIKNVTINAEAELMAYSGNHPNIEQWANYFKDKLYNERLPFIKNALNNQSRHEYDTLRNEAYPAVALAHWYKTLDRSKIPYGNQIDTNNISDIQISFDSNYWANQSLQFLYSIPSYPASVWGGVAYWGAVINLTGGISDSTQSLMENATIQSYVNISDDYYFSTTIQLNDADLVPLALGFSSSTPSNIENINTTVAIENEGNLNTTNFTVYIYDKYTYSNGHKAKYDLTKINTSLTAGELKLVSFLWNTSNSGSHSITAVVDYYNVVKETNEINNRYSYTINVLDAYPQVQILLPLNVSLPAGIITLIGSGTDNFDGYLSDGNYNWTSSKDGYLGNSSILPINLSSGNHVITLTVKNSKNLTASTQTSLSIYVSGSPTLTILSPADGKIAYKNETIFFSANATDPDDGILTGNSIVWNSSINGIIGYGNSFNLNYLNVGNHTIIVTATDSSNYTDIKNITLNIIEEPAELTTTSNGTTNESLIPEPNATFTSKIIYLRLPKVANVTSAFLTLKDPPLENNTGNETVEENITIISNETTNVTIENQTIISENNSVQNNITINETIDQENNGSVNVINGINQSENQTILDANISVLSNVPEVTLISNTDQCLVNCETVYKICNNEKNTISLANPHFSVNFFGDVQNLKEYNIEVLVNETYTDSILIGDINCNKNLTINNQYIFNCGDSGQYKNIKKILPVWKDLQTQPKNLYPKECKYIKVKGKKEPKIGQNNIDNVITFNDKIYNEYAWWNSSWEKKQSINIQENSGSNLTNYTIKLNISYENYMQSNFGDLRFLDSSETKEIDYWIEDKINNSFVTIWIKILNLTSFTNTTVYMYYNNSFANTTSNIKNTFIIGDDFDDNSIDFLIWWVGWSGEGSFIENNGIFTLSALSSYDDAEIKSNIYTFGSGTELRSKVNLTGRIDTVSCGGYADNSGGGFCDLDDGSSIIKSNQSNNIPIYLVNKQGGGGIGGNRSFVTFNASTGIYDVYIIYKKSNYSQVISNYDNVTNPNYYVNTGKNLGWVVRSFGNSTELHIDWTFARNYVEQEPTYTFGFFESLVKNPKMYVNDTLVWNHTGSFLGPENVTNWSIQLNNYLQNCNNDICDIPLNFTWENDGILKVYNINITYYNAIPPIINNLEINPNPALPSDTLSIKVNATDNYNNISRVNVSLTTNTVTLSYNSTSLLYEGTLTSPAEGNYYLNVTAFSNVGLKATTEELITVQNNLADLTITPIDINLNPQSIAEPNNLTINITVRNNGGTDANSFYVEFLINNISQSYNLISVPAQSNTITQFNWTSNYGAKTLTFKADSTNLITESNKSNNNISKNIFVIDNIASLSPNLTANPGSWANQDTFNISWNTLTDTNGINRYEYQIDYGNWTSNSLSTSFITPSLSEGIHTVYVRGVDTPGNLGNIGNVSIYRDNTAPNTPVIREWHTGGIWTQHTDPYFTWLDPGDEGSGVTNYYASIDNGTAFSLNSSLDYHVNLTTGIHNFKIYAVDAINNTSPWSNIITVYIDDTKPLPPTITSSTHSDNNTWYTNNIPIFNFSIPGDDSSIYGYYYILTDNSSLEVNENSGIFTNSTNFNITFIRNSQQNGTTTEGFPTGTWYIKTVSVDNAGNIGNVSNYYQFRVDITAPTIEQTNITNSQGNITETNPARKENITINVSINDTGSGISSVWLVVWDGIAELSNKLWEGFMNLVSGIWTAIIPINQTFSPTTNYTIYSNDTLGNIGSINGSFNVKIPRVNSLILNSTYNTNTIYENLTCYNYTTSADNSIYNFWLNNISDNVLNLPFDTNSVVSTKDYSGYGNNGNVSVSGTINPIWNSSCKIGGCYKFDGTTDYINISDSPSLSFKTGIGSPDKPFSVEAWVNPSSSGTSFVIAKEAPTTGSNREWQLIGDYAATGKAHFAIYENIWTPSIARTAPVTGMTVGAWHHLVGTYDGSQTSAGIKIYLDGVRIDNLDDNYGVYTGGLDTASSVTIGATNIITTFMNGSIDEVRIYNRTLSLNEILDHNATIYNKVRNDRLVAGQNWICQIYPTDSNLTGIPANSTALIISNTLPSVNNVTIITTDMTKNDTKQNVSLQISMSDPNNDGLTNITSWYVNGKPYSVLNMPFNTNNNTDAKDYSGNENNGIVTGAKWNNSGRIGGAYIFNGSTDYISIGDSNLLSFANNIMTIELWFKANRLSGQQDLVWKGSSQNEEYEIYLDSNVLKFITYKPYCGIFCSRQIGFAQSGTLSENQWYHVVAIRNTTTQMLYINGNRVDIGDAYTGMYNGVNDLSLGARESVFFFNGTMDNVMIYNRTLSASEIYEHNKTNYNFISSDNLVGGQIWKAQVWANDGWGDSVSMNSSELTILNTVPVINNLVLNSTDVTSNNTNQNLTLSYSIADLDGDALTNVTTWWMNNQTFANLIMPLDGGSVKDYASGITGSINGAIYSSSCRLNGCYHFNGDDNINLGAPDKLKIVHPTIEAWFKTNASAVQYIYRWRQYGVYLYLNASGSVLTTFWRSDGTPFTVGSAESYNDNNWHYAAGTYNGTDLKVYVDGVEKGTTSASGSIHYDDGIQLATIGSDGAITSYFIGFIDELRIYNMTLSPEQIALHNKTQFNIIHSSLTNENQTWMAQVYVNDTKTEVYANSSSIKVL